MISCFVSSLPSLGCHSLTEVKHWITYASVWPEGSESAKKYFFTDYVVDYFASKGPRTYGRRNNGKIKDIAPFIAIAGRYLVLSSHRICVDMSHNMKL